MVLKLNKPGGDFKRSLVLVYFEKLKHINNAKCLNIDTANYYIEEGIIKIITQNRLSDMWHIIFTFFIASISVIICAVLLNLIWYIITK